MRRAHNAAMSCFLPRAAPAATSSTTATAALLIAFSSLGAVAAPACPDNRAALTERFTSADCADCWAAAPPGAASTGWLFDWIAPTPQGNDAPLATAAVAEARDRAQRLGGAAPVASQVLVQREPAPRTPGLSLNVHSGPAWNGYFGLQLNVRGRLPAGSTGWLALVEVLPAGSEGSTVERQLLRSVAGPLPLDSAGRPQTPQLGRTQGLQHLRALRWPEGAQPTRLQARGWIEGPDGRMLAVASDQCAWR